MGRRGADMEIQREVERHKDAKRYRDAEWAAHTHMWWIKIRSDTSGVRDPSPTPDPTKCSSTSKISPHNFWL